MRVGIPAVRAGGYGRVHASEYAMSKNIIKRWIPGLFFVRVCVCVSVRVYECVCVGARV